MKRRLHVRTDELHLREKTCKHAFYGRVQIRDAFLHRRHDVLIAQVGRGNNRQSRFQLGRDGLFVVTGGQADIPERNEHHPYGHHRQEKHISEQDGEGRAHGKAQQGCRADKGKPSAPAGDLEDFLHLRDFPAEKGCLFAPRGLVDLRAEIFVPPGQKPEQRVGKLKRRDSEQ